MQGMFRAHPVVWLAGLALFTMAPAAGAQAPLHEQELGYRIARASDASGRVPAGALQNATVAMEALPGGSSGPPLPPRTAAMLGLAPAPGGIGGLVVGPPTISPWQSQGPRNLGGRTRALIAVSATRLFAGAAGGGVWRSDDAGFNWTQLTGFPSNLPVSALAAEPGDPLRIYAGTGEGFGTGSALPGGGIYTSTDGGDSWAALPATAPPNTSFLVVNRIAVSANNPARLYAATGTGLFRSTNRGTTWTSVLSGDHRDVAVRGIGSSDLVLAFRPGTLSRSADNGTSFATAAGLPGTMQRATLTFAPDGDGWALLAGSDGRFLGLFRSSDAGQNWVRREKIGTSNQAEANLELLNDARLRLDFYNPTGGDCPGFDDPATADNGLFAMALGISPADSDRVWVGGVDLWRSINAGTDFGPASYSSKTEADNDFVRADQHAIVFRPGYDGTTNQTIYFAGDGGIFKTDNADGQVVTILTNNQVVCQLGTPLPDILFTPLNTDYRVTQFNSGGVHPTANVIYGGTLDTAIARYDGNAQQDWARRERGIGNAVAVERTDPNLVYATGLLSDPPTLGDFYRSTDAGGTFTRSITGIDDSGPFALLAPLGVDPVNAQTLWFGGRRPHRSTDGGAIWVPAVFMKPLTSAPISAWAISPSSGGNVVYLGCTDGALFESRDALAASPVWTKLDFATALPNRFISSMAVDPTDENRLFIAFAGFDVSGGLMNGQLWICPDTRTPAFVPAIGNPGAQIPNIPLNCVLIHPNERDVMFVASDTGVMVTSDRTASWSSISSPALSTTRVTHLALQQKDRLLAFTYGRGVFSSVVDVPLVTVGTPQNGERVLPGATRSVTWSVSEASNQFDQVDHFDLFYARDGSTFDQLISLNVTGTARSFDWPVPAAERTTSARVRVQAFDASSVLIGADASDLTFIINGQPVADAGPDQIVLPTANVTIDATGSTDPEGDSLTYLWAQVTPALPVAPIIATQPVNTFAMPAQRGFEFLFGLTVNDGLEDGGDTTRVRVNQLPVTSAGPDRRAAPGTLVTLAGSGSSDADGQPLTFLWTQLTGPVVAFAATSANTTFTAPLPRGSILNFQLDATDGLESLPDTVRVTVNRVPVAVASSPARVVASAVFTLTGSLSNDADFDPLTFLWTQLSGPGVPGFNRTVANPTVSAPPAPGSVLPFSLVVSDGVESATANTTVTVNRKPVASIVAPAAVEKSTVVNLTGSASTDGDGDALVYTWAQLTGPPVTFATATANTSFTAPATSGVSIEMRLTVSDGLETSTALHTVRVNTVPVVSAGPDRRVGPAAQVSLDGLATVDPDGDPITYAWLQTSGPAVTLAGAAGALASFTAPVTRGDVMAFRLTASDGVQSAFDDVTVRVNQLPAARPVGPTVVKPGVVVSLSGATSTDPDADSLTYLWAQTGGPAVAFATTSVNISYTAPASRGAAIALTLRASDGVETHTAALSTRVNQLPEPRVAAPEQVVAPDSTVTLDAVASTDPDGDALAYAWAQNSGPAVAFDAAAASPAFSVAGIARGQVLLFTVTTSDGLEVAAATARVRVNQSPVVKVAAQMTAIPSELVRISATASADPDEDPLKFRWRQTSGPAVSFEPTGSTLSFTAPAVGLQSLGFDVEVTDGVESSTAAVKVDLTDRTYEAGLNETAGAAGGCDAGRHGERRGPGSLAGIWLMALFLAWKKHKG